MLERELRAYYAAASPPARAARVVRDGGMGSLAIKTAGELGYRRLVILEHDLSELEASDEAAVDVELGELSDTREYRSLRPEQSVESVKARLDAGGTCFCARLAGRPVSITWAYSGWAPVPYLWSELESDGDSILLQDTFTAPDLRGRGISPALARLIVSWARRRGCRRLLTGVLPENQASLRARRKAGFRVIATARCIGRGRRAGRLVHGMQLTFPQDGR